MITFYGPINTIYQFIKPFFDKTMSVFEEYGALNVFPYFSYRRENNSFDYTTMCLNL